MTNARHTKFYLDTQKRKWSGVCAGIADYTGLDATVVRFGAVVLTLLGGFPWTVIAYFVAAWMAPKKPVEFYGQDPEQTKFWQGVRASPARSVRDVRSRLRDIDRRMAEVEMYVTSSDTRLAREIEQLR
jgi:phage shock protein C